MISRAPEGPAREVFLEQLNGFYVTCGRPRYREIAGISERLDDFYPLAGDRKRDLPTLSPSGISEVLAGRRKNLPSAGWLAAFVLSCQRRAWELGALDKDPGVSTLPEWHRKLAEAQVGGNSAGPDRPAGQSGDRSAPRPRANDVGAAGSDRPVGNADHPADQPPGVPPGPPLAPPRDPPSGPVATLPAARAAGRRSAVV